MGQLAFRDAAEQAAFDNEGYFIRRLFDAETASRLHAECLERAAGKTANHEWDSNYYSMLEADSDSFSDMSQLSWRAMAEPIERLATGWQMIQSGVLGKMAGGGITHLHVHPPPTDQPFAVSAFCWCALADCDEENGCLYVIPRTQRLVRYINTGDAGFINDLDLAARIVREHAVPVPLKAGEAIVVDNTLMHGAFPNQSSQIRLALCSLFANADAIPADYRYNEGGILVTPQPTDSYSARAASTVEFGSEREQILRRLPDWRSYPNYAQFEALLQANGPRATEEYDPMDTVRHLEPEQGEPAPSIPALPPLKARLRAALARRAPLPVKKAYRRLRGYAEPLPPAGNASADFAPYPEPQAMPRPFRDDAIDTALHEEGYATFPFLSETEIDRLANVVDEAEDRHDRGDVHIPTHFRLSAFNNDGAYKERLFDAVWDCIGGKVEEKLPGFEPLVINIFDKQPGGGYDPVPIHQNPSFVDEPAHKSVSLWIPFCDVARDNGTVGVLPRSHNRFNRMRAGNMAHEDVFALVQSDLENELFVPVEMKKGEMLALDDSIIHWSYPNISDRQRKAVQLIMVPKGVPHIYYYYDDEQGGHPMMDLYEVDKNFFFGFNCKARPETLKHIDRVPYRYRPITGAEIQQVISAQ